MYEEGEVYEDCPECGAELDGGRCSECTWGPIEDWEEGAEEEIWDEYDEEIWRRREFQDPGGRSALRRETRDNPRVHPCPTCGRENMLTPKDVALKYQCNDCADAAEGRSWF